MNKHLRTVFAMVAMVATLSIAPASRLLAQANEWTGAVDDNWNTNGNWSAGGAPDVSLDDSASITNGDTVFLSAPAAFQSPELNVVGSGLEIRPGGGLTIQGDVTIGANGTLTIIGSGQTFSSTQDVSFAASAVYVPEITSLAGHTAIQAAGTLDLGGATLQPTFTVSPTGGETWIIGDASVINGSFNIDDSMAGLSPGTSFRLSQVAGGTNGQQLILGIQSTLALIVNADTGVASLSSPTGTPIAITAYSLLSPQGHLNPAGWNSLDDQNVSSFQEVGPLNSNFLDELAGPVNASTAGSLSVTGAPRSIGAAVVTGLPFASTPNLSFEYATTTGELVEGEVVLTGLNAVNNLLLTVDPSTGQAELKNSSTSTLQLKAYSLGSASGSLKPNNGDWNSLDDQNVDNSGVGGTNGFVREANGSTFFLSELIPDDLTTGAERTLTLSPGEAYAMGDLFDTSGSQDLELQFVLELEGLNGDYNGDGTVNLADYTVWRDNLGSSETLPGDTTPGTVSAADYQVWKGNFGDSGAAAGLQVFDGVVRYQTLPAAFASAQAIPEPSTGLLAALTSLVLAVCGRVRWANARLIAGVAAVLSFTCLLSPASAQIDLSGAQVWTSSEESAIRSGEKAFDGSAAAQDNKWGTQFLGGVGDDQTERNEWLLVDLGADFDIGRIEVNWETARAEDYTWRIRTAAQGLPTPTPVDLDRASVNYADWTEIASVQGALSVGNNRDLTMPDQIFDWDNNIASTTGVNDGPITLTAPSPTGRYLLMAITDNWFRNGSTGSSPYEVKVFESLGDIVPGDTNGDGIVNQTDFENIRTNFRNAIPGGTTDAAARLLGDIGNSSLQTARDGVVDLYDFILWEQNYPTAGGLSAAFGSVAVPEPSSIGLGLLCGAFVWPMLRRRVHRAA